MNKMNKMNKVNKVNKVKIIVPFLLAWCGGVMAQITNTSAQNGNWSECTTWGNPASVGNQNNSVKNINNTITLDGNFSSGTINMTGGRINLNPGMTINLMTGGTDTVCDAVWKVVDAHSGAVTGGRSCANFNNSLFRQKAIQIEVTTAGRVGLCTFGATTPITTGGYNHRFENSVYQSTSGSSTHPDTIVSVGLQWISIGYSMSCGGDCGGNCGQTYTFTRGTDSFTFTF